MLVIGCYTKNRINCTIFVARTILHSKSKISLFTQSQRVRDVKQMQLHFVCLCYFTLARTHMQSLQTHTTTIHCYRLQLQLHGRCKRSDVQWCIHPKQAAKYKLWTILCNIWINICVRLLLFFFKVNKLLVLLVKLNFIWCKNALALYIWNIL